jgi:hypothetical protein
MNRILIAAVSAYLLIPQRIRHVLFSWGGGPSANFALADLRAGKDWRYVLRHYAKVPWDNPPMPPG